MDDLRFNVKLRYQRMWMAAATIILAVPVALMGAVLKTLYIFIAGFSVGMYMGVNGFLNGLIATWWYAYKVVIVNWKD